MPSTAIIVHKTYSTKTPFPYAELSGEFNGKHIVIGVTLFAPGTEASISGVLSRGTVDEEVTLEKGDRDERRTVVHDVTAWHARLRTDRETLNELVHKHFGAAADAPLELSWDNTKLSEDTNHTTFFGRHPRITIVAGSCDRQP